MNGASRLTAVTKVGPAAVRSSRVWLARAYLGFRAAPDRYVVVERR
ncbi:MAG: hypothetical protein M3312_06835 [Actinomycetota bacterium]|nr:hypothetical protein [Actinomycetota bacterium]